MACCIHARELARNRPKKKKVNQLLEGLVNEGIESRMTVFIVVEYLIYLVIHIIHLWKL